MLEFSIYFDYVINVYWYFHSLLTELNNIEEYIKNLLQEIFFPPTVDEWIGTNISPIKSHLFQIKTDAEFQLSLGCCIRGVKKISKK